MSIVLCWKNKYKMNLYNADTRLQLQHITESVIGILEHDYGHQLLPGITELELYQIFFGPIKELFELINQFDELSLDDIRTNLVVVSSREIDENSYLFDCFAFGEVKDPLL